MKLDIRKLTIGACALILILVAGLGDASAGGPPKDSLTIAGQTDSNHFSPILNGNEYHYYTTVPAFTAVADTVPVQFMLTGTHFPHDMSNNCTAGATVTANATGQVASAISFDVNPFTMCDGDVVTHNIIINTTLLAPGDYVANVTYRGPNNAIVDDTHDVIHFHIHAIPDPNAPPHCFLTDSSGLLLTDCGGNFVDNNGSFIIVTNGRKITATNPGQFYLNLVWTNGTGSDQTFSGLTLTNTNALPQGTNSVHVLIYNANQVTASFDDVNTGGIPCGQTGSTCKSPITVPSGQTLWLTWHVAYQWLGSTDLSNIPFTCGTPSTRGTITLSATLTNAAEGPNLSCSSTANGFRIQ